MTSAAAASTSLLPAVTWSLLNFLWQGAVLGLALVAGLRISARAPSSLRYAICCAAFGGMVLCPIFTFARLELYHNTQALPTVAAATASLTSLPQADSVWAASRINTLISWMDGHLMAILVIWLAGALIFCIRVLASIAATERLETASIAPASDDVQSLASNLASKLKVTVPFRVIISRNVTAPGVIGWRNPSILLPCASLQGLSPEQAETILAHELAHIQRRDYLVNLLQIAVETMLYYHPATWWASRQIRREREHCCDDRVLSAGGSAVAYAKALVMLEEQRSPAQTIFSLAMSGGNLSMRIKRLFDPRVSARCTRNAGISLASLGVITTVALAMLSISAVAMVSAQTAPQPPQPHETATAPGQRGRPDLACTYYGFQAPSKFAVGEPGVCEGSSSDPNVYYCSRVGARNLRQYQIGCKWKVQRLRAWEQQHGEK